MSDLITMREAVEITGSPSRLHAAIRDGRLTAREHQPLRFDRRDVVEATAEPLSVGDQADLDFEANRLPNGLMPADEEALAQYVLTPAEALEIERALIENPIACACVGCHHGGSLCHCHLRAAAIARALEVPCVWCDQAHSPLSEGQQP